MTKSNGSAVSLVLATLMLQLTTPGATEAQTFQGTITGLVEDSQGQPIPGATVSIENEKTGETRRQPSTSSGAVVFPNLLLGSYTLRVELTGFKKYERTGIQVKSNTNVDVKARMDIGGVEEVITVTGGADLIKTTSSQLEGGTFSARQLTDIPVYDPTLSGDVTNFAVLAAGVGTQSGGVAGQGGVIGGNRPRNNSFVVDGLDNNDSSVTGAVAVPIQDSVAEFQLITNLFSAEFGHSTAGQFVTATKSGTNAFSGSLWEYNINRRLLSLDNLTRATAVGDSSFEKPRFDRNRTGASLGGPIVKDRWFFYGAYEFQNLNLAGSSTTQILVPTTAGLATLQALANTPGSGVSPVNVGLLEDHVPAASTETSVVSVLNQSTGQPVEVGVGPFSGSAPNFLRTHVGQFNTDVSLGEHRLGARLFYSRSGQIAVGPLPTAEFNSDPTNKIGRGTLSWVWAARGNVINEFRTGHTKLTQDFPVDLPTPPGSTDIFANYVLNDIGLEIGPGSNFPQTSERSTLQFSNTTTWIRGAHTLKWGGEYRRLKGSGGFLPRSRGEYSYQSLDEFVRDQVPGVLAARGTGSPAFIADRDAAYGFIQDSWRVAPRLTLDLGLRYEWTGVARDAAAQELNALANVDIRGERDAAGQIIFDTLTPAHQQLLLAEFPDARVIFTKPKSDKNNLGPRVGFAWDVNGDGKSSLRGGFAIAHDVVFGNLPLLQLPPQFQVETTEAVACALSPAPDWCSIPRDQVQFSNVGFLAGGGILPTIDASAATDPGVARAATQAYTLPQETVPETWTWSLSYQRELSRDFVGEVRYIGTQGRDLPVQRRRNAGIPNPVQLPIFASEQDALSQTYAGAPTLDAHLSARTPLLGPFGFAGNVTAFDPAGSSRYHGGSISLTRRFTSGWGLNVNYTLSRTEDDSENELNTSALNPRRPENFWDIEANRGLSGLHKAHKVAASFQWELPKTGAGLEWLLGGWVLNGAFIFETGQALTIQSARDQNGDFDATGDRAWINPLGNGNLGTDTSFVCFDGGRTFIGATAGACGGNSNVVGYVSQDPNAGWVRGREGAQRGVGLEKSARGAFIGPGNIHFLNLGLYKNTRLGGRTHLRLGITCNNCTNTPSFALGTGSGILSTTAATGSRAFVTPGTPQFLDNTIFSGGLGSQPYQRIVQLEAKLSF